MKKGVTKKKGKNGIKNQYACPKMKCPQTGKVRYHRKLDMRK